jgi:hypothetical protein
MAQASESTVSAILKEVYPGAIEDELNEEVGLWAIVDREKVTIDGQGQHIVRPFRVSRNQGLGARNDTDILPQPGSQGLQRAQINMSSNYLIGQITGRVIRTSYGDDATFENALSEEIQFNLTDLGTEIGYQLYGLMGQRTTVNGTVTSSTSVVVNNTQYLAVGMYVEFWNGSTNQTTNDAGLPAGITGTQITAINNATNTLTVTTAQASITSGAGVSRAQNNTAQTTTKEMYGLDFFYDNNTDYAGVSFFGVSRTTYPIIQGNRFSAAHALTENLMQQAFDTARQIGGGIINFVTCDYATRRVYTNLLASLKRYPLEGVQAPQFAGGLDVSQDLRNQLGEGLSFSGAPVAPSRLAPPAEMFMFPTSSLKLFQQSEIEWVMNGDSILHPLLATGYDAYRFALFYDAQFYCEAPNRGAKVVQTF